MLHLTCGPAAAEFEAPQAGNTQVLVVGATGRVGRILVRKLLLRGYKVRAFVRQGDEAGEEQQAQRPAGKLPVALLTCREGYTQTARWSHACVAQLKAAQSLYAVASLQKGFPSMHWPLALLLLNMQCSRLHFVLMC